MPSISLNRTASFFTAIAAAMPAASATEETGHACPARRIPSMSWAFPLIRYPNRTVTIRVPYSRTDSPQIHAERPIGGAEQN